MNLKGLTHDFCLKSEVELQCCDGARPRKTPSIPPSEVSIFAKAIPWHGATRHELMAHYGGKEFEIALCEGCYDSILCRLLDRQ